MNLTLLMVAGGLGLFLLGMLLMTDGLKGLAGNTLRRALARFTRSPASGAATGAIATAVIQSSSATTVTAVGFVGAGLLSFPQALGIIFGANVGTTITGWMVAVIGFKLDIGLAVLPLVLIGAALRLFGGRKAGQIGWALAGFALLFIGLDFMREGMAAYEGAISPEDFPPDTFLGRLLLVGMGIVITLITQSSSAGVAAALVALAAGTISFAQAAALVIGMDVGTTFTAAIATIGGAPATRRTGYAHVIYNLMTAVIAFFLLGGYAGLVREWVGAGGIGNAQIALVGFHTSFNLLGIILVLPLADRFARLMEWLVPERGPALQRRLDLRLLKAPAAATDAALATLGDIALALFGVLARRLDRAENAEAGAADLNEAATALGAAEAFIDGIDPELHDPVAHRRYLDLMHLLDHLARLLNRSNQWRRIAALKDEKSLEGLVDDLRAGLTMVISAGNPATVEGDLEGLKHRLEEAAEPTRRSALRDAAARDLPPEAALKLLDGIRWLHRVAHHMWRIAHHLRLSAGPPDHSSLPVAGDPRRKGSAAEV